MKLIDMEEAPLAIREQAWTLYTESFPDYERRSRQAHHAATEDAEFRSKIAVGDNGELIALLFYWIHEGLLFIEHIAVDHSMRGNNIGSKLISELRAKHSDETVILEIDPPIDEISKRRLEFYQRLGFVENDFQYVHPSYARGDNALPHNLVIMSHKRKLTDEEFAEFKDYLYNTILTYIG